jgi:glucose uptake protein
VSGHPLGYPMYIVSSYPVALAFCVVTMLCWGSWANTQKLASKAWRFQLFYWDYALGVLLFSLVLAFTLGSSGTGGRGFLADLHQAETQWLLSAFSAASSSTSRTSSSWRRSTSPGMAVAFPVGVGLALVIGVVSTYAVHPAGNVLLLAVGVAGVASRSSSTPWPTGSWRAAA